MESVTVIDDVSNKVNEVVVGEEVVPLPKEDLPPPKLPKPTLRKEEAIHPRALSKLEELEKRGLLRSKTTRY